MDDAQLQAREKKLQDLTIYLKKEFIGLDDQIDKIVDNIKIWYVLPEILDRPVIVNLWGMTGTGKTDLVRKIVSFLGFDDDFMEVQMGAETKIGGEHSSKSATTVRDLLIGSDLKEKEPSIMLFDEFQRFRRIDENGDMKDDKTFDDIWMLLSDGKFSTQIRGSSKEFLEEEIESVESHIEYFEFKNEELKKEGETPKEESTLKIYSWQKTKYKVIAKKIKWKKPLKTYFDVIEMLESVPEEFNLFSGQEYTKSLIFVCGNIDDAYHMSGSISGDGDADILHNYSKRINIIKIKKCLMDLFKPEQIARLGNNHVIYPCLNKKNYRELIRRTIDGFLERIENTTKITFNYDEKLVDLVYNNFVYPSQGTRPVFSGINSLLSAAYPKVLFKYIRNKMKGDISFVVENGELHIVYEGVKETDIVDYQFDLDNIRKAISQDKMTMFSVHETGHAIIYARLFGYAPKQIKVDLTSFDGAYVIPDTITQNKKYLKNMIKVYLAGTLAEKMVFGDEMRSTGCQSDLESATELSTRYVRCYGFNDRLVASANTKSINGSGYILDDTEENDHNIVRLLQEMEEEVREMLETDKDLLIAIADYVLTKKEVSGKEFAEMFGDEYFGGLKFVNPLDFEYNDDIVDGYEAAFEKFKKLKR